MICLLTTTQRCGSTWLTRMLSEMTGSPDLYVDGLAMGFRLAKPSEAGAVERLADFLRRHPGIRVFKTHDVPSADFDAVCAAMPELRILTMQRDFKDVVVSRYFYSRYYWRTDARLGPLPEPAARFLAEIGEMPDAGALAALIERPLVRDWAREWAAFEGPFTTPRAMRASYAGMLDESEFPRLAEFTGLPLCKLRPFRNEQQQETQETGRDGKARFNRRGLVGEWREWWTAEQGAWLASLVCDAHPAP